MANHPSAERRNRQRIKQTNRNRSIKSSTRTALRKARAALAAGDVKLAETLVRDVESRLDRATTKGVLHRKAASRVKSRLSTQLHKLSTAS
ncbi:MAG TPA: 30S ribosomal protein S20 [Polyangiaceae bacterium]|jgi:small subunit ribosomal protein S20|nr:MAG: 30S ribosomal protein S20 [Deltaproteobacteria bacterium ADurb.Bin207]HNS95887.1 30S ribosomal protein S20 [Polyangiaceae bacterium]HNZ24551.1 30S ribosomal protein S20 [Polyangiaceae bacterium]HOD21963.1 30S ribosomal protein S20 [Polyangiaceae bacterium]HOE47929.1 30S ribosomal protein S20 [Polyangiaceae bacterium]